MNFAKAFTGVVAGAVASVAAGFLTAFAGMATFTLLPAVTAGAVVGLLLSIINMGQQQGVLGNAFIGALLTMLGYFFTVAVVTGSGAVMAIVTGAVVGVIYTLIVDSMEG